ncbi:hypothetical protein PFICI_03605 [Pestalotiopsis fici W106-1]|uniref:Uncharacterized protein n=1 Tax=Pestalotiopsis fici (strain W106-1 / CGMCC3.15140) TaxID=1229662 RepID=W3XHS8_PESFW|nr:uncharacterized protein PFICI_03605 [Pestalotiopsis fici W106-1]ETS85580.1 hypothetical protein PFICI_03605 [Pestalotiopsis fici W106-1]
MKVALLLSWIAVATAAPTPKLKNSEADPLLSIRKTDELWQRTAQEDCGICEGEVTAEIGKTDELWQRTVDEDCTECEGETVD